MTIEQLIGAWELRSLYAESLDGERSHPYGESPVGLLIYEADGAMAVVNWVGTDQVRYFELSDGELRIATPPILHAGKEWTIHVLFRRRTPTGD
jgi:hypothetical protein